MTNADVLRLLELGVPTAVIVERIRANQTHFTKLDGLLAAIRSRDSSAGKDPRFLRLVAEISAASYREGEPCAEHSTACPPLAAELSDPAPAASREAVAASTDPPPQPARPAAIDPPSVPATAPAADPPPASAKPAAASATPAAAAPQSGQPAVAVPATAPTPVPAAVPTPPPAGSPTPASATGAQPSKVATNFAQKQTELMADEYEKNKYRNPNLVINPLRLVFDTTEAGEKIDRDIAVSIKHKIQDLKVLSIRLSSIDELDKPPEAFSLVQPDLQCPEVASSEAECHLKVQFHPEREGFFSGYVNIITEDVVPEAAPPANPVQPHIYFDRAYIHGTGYVSDVVRLNGTGPLSNQPGLRSVMGFDISGASNAQTQQKFFLEFNINAPIGFARLGMKDVPCTDPSLPECKEGHKNVVHPERRDPLSRPLWLFLNPRITSVPQSPSSLGSLNIQSISDSILSDKNTTSLVQGMDVTGGLEYFFIKPRQGLPFWSVVKNARARTGIALVGGVGFTTPFSPPDKTTQEFTINSTILAQFPDAGKPQVDPNGNPVTPTIIAFVNKDRTRFFRRYYTGLRFKTYFFSDRVRGECDDPRSGDGCEAVMNLFPGVFDLTVGKDEAVTGGRFSNWVLRLDAVYPLPFNPAFHIFGGANVAFGRNTTTLPLVLEPPQTFLNLSDPHVFVQALDPPNRDTYRIGIGVDLLQIIKSKAGKPAAAAEPPKESGKN